MTPLPEHDSLPPLTPLQEAFDRVMVKARWGVIGALLGAALMSAINYFSVHESRPVFMAILGSVGGAFGGAVRRGGLRAIGFSMMTCVVLGFCCCPLALGPQNHLTENGLLLILACAVAIGFMIGTVIEFASHWGYKQPDGLPENAAHRPPDDQPNR